MMQAFNGSGKPFISSIDGIFIAKNNQNFYIVNIIGTGIGFSDKPEILVDNKKINAEGITQIDNYILPIAIPSAFLNKHFLDNEIAKIPLQLNFVYTDKEPIAQKYLNDSLNKTDTGKTAKAIKEAVNGKPREQTPEEKKWSLKVNLVLLPINGATITLEEDTTGEGWSQEDTLKQIFITIGNENQEKRERSETYKAKEGEKITKVIYIAPNNEKGGYCYALRNRESKPYEADYDIAANGTEATVHRYMGTGNITCEYRIMGQKRTSQEGVTNKNFNVSFKKPLEIKLDSTNSKKHWIITGKTFDGQLIYISDSVKLVPGVSNPLSQIGYSSGSNIITVYLQP